MVVVVLSSFVARIWGPSSPPPSSLRLSRVSKARRRRRLFELDEYLRKRGEKEGREFTKGGGGTDRGAKVAATAVNDRFM